MGPDLTVVSGGSLDLTAGRRVTLLNGVVIEGDLTITIDPNLPIAGAREAAAQAGFVVP